MFEFVFQLEFPNTVRWMVLEFDHQCATAQVEDSLQLYIPAWRPRSDASVDSESAQSILETPTEVGPNYWPVLQKFHGSSNWPKQSIVLPGKIFCSSFFGQFEVCDIGNIKD